MRRIVFWKFELENSKISHLKCAWAELPLNLQHISTPLSQLSTRNCSCNRVKVVCKNSKIRIKNKKGVSTFFFFVFLFCFFVLPALKILQMLWKMAYRSINRWCYDNVTFEGLNSAIEASEEFTEMIRNGSANPTPLLNTNTFHVVFSLLTGLSCFIPLCMGVTSNLEKRPLREALQKGSGFTYSCIAAITLVIPLLVDLLIDIGYEIATVVVKPSGKITARFNFLNKPERTLFLLGIAVLPLLILVPKSTPNLALIYICCNKCQQSWIGGTVALSLCRYDKQYFSVKSTWASLIFFAMAMIGSTFIDNLYAIKPPAQHIVILDMGTFILSGIPCVLFFLNSSRWLILAHYRAIQWTNVLFFYSKSRQIHPSATTDISANSDHTFFPMIYTLIGMTVLVLLSVLIGTSSRIEDYDETNLVQGNIPFLVFIISVSILSMRMVKFEVIQGLVSDVCLSLVLLVLSCLVLYCIVLYCLVFSCIVLSCLVSFLPFIGKC